ncbi:MAG TPA: prepilin-type N-terminal cleavage/methylation domain-containing protein [Smithella sp.]|nr:prepilin-type N-terminal cleavage/methylation domain-containing protein [Smithella sp.]
MLRIICNKKGISIIEMMVAVVITMIGVLSILMLQSSSWKTVSKSDYLGRAAEILAGELQRRESLIMNPRFFVETGTTAANVMASSETAAVEGDATYTVRTRIESIGTDVWRVTVTVTWPPLNNTGITENIVVTRQERFSFM